MGLAHINETSSFVLARTLVSVSLIAASSVVQAQATEHRMVSSDGSVLAPLPQSSLGSLAFEGTQRSGMALDANAEFPSKVLSDVEMSAFRQRYQPKRAPHSRAADGQLQPETVIGRDRRFRIYPRESGFPYRAIGMLTFSQGLGDYSCTGFLISKDTVATAGHCVYDAGWSTNVRFYPAFNSGVAPYGSCSARRLYTVVKWVEGAGDRSDEFDYGAVKLNCEVGRTTGWFGYYPSLDSQVGLSVLVMGYPGDKPQGTMWGAAGDITASARRKTRYMLDTGGGESGAPVFEADRGRSRAGCFGTCAVAIHGYGEIAGTNSGARINYGVAQNLAVWKDAP